LTKDSNFFEISSRQLKYVQNFLK